MNFIFPIFAAILQAGSFTLDKITLTIRRVSYKTYTGASFPLIFVITLVIFFIFRPPLSFQLISGKLLWFLLLSVGLIIITNLLFYRALDDDKLGEIQTFDLLPKIPAIIFSSIIFVDERHFLILIPALVAALAIIWSHWEHHHFKIAKHTLPFVVWALAMAPFGPALSKTLLVAWHPISLELVRSGMVALVLGPLFFKYAERVSLRAGMLLIATNILTSVAWILYYFSYQISGIIYTMLLFSLQPLLVYFASLFLLREKFNRKKLIAFFVILLSIAIAQISV